MKATRRDYAAVVGRAGAKCRLFFFCGPDEAGASAAAARTIAGFADPGERVDLSGQELKGDPARLLDEARSTSLFGDSRHVYVRVNGEEAHDAIRTYAEMADSGEAANAWPVVIVATSATDKSRSAKLLLKRDDALVAVFYPPEPGEVTAQVRSMADAAGLRLSGGLAERIARAASLDVRLARSEVEKLALYLDASPHSPRLADGEALDAIGAKTEEDGIMPLVDAALGGKTGQLTTQLARMREVSLNPVGVALALERRVAQLAGLAARFGPGDEMTAFLARERVFFRDRDEIGNQLHRWSGAKLERLVPRLTDLHRSLLTNSQSAELLLARELTLIARYAASRR
ncbi:DNA polymerase III subunit delta [Aurantiacibacter spongiae]|uniref:DNA-directed DNA polymerase n=1 Tax=Aurantiacibacter spongiae TaxID=2488860 RepID=A0A3N5CQX0_9SPHN|nr:DNA polymerase III subunit delta [Aurantiacibacter spongiae]RPF71444.1 DNA polymerase III subunit delta [Aurantiacibacter spongiae]